MSRRRKITTAAGADCFETARRQYGDRIDPYFVSALESLGLGAEFTAAEGSYIYDQHGNDYLDFVAGYGSVAIGHNHPLFTERLRRALVSNRPALLPLGVNATAARLAVRLCSLAGPEFDKVQFATTGAEAVESALQIAMAVTGRRKLVSSRGAYHGLTLGALSLASAESPWRGPFARLCGESACLDLSDLRGLRRHLQDGQTAAVVLEMVQNFGGGRAPDAPLEIQRLCAESGTLLIVDEVLTGLGRTGSWFAYQQAGPDFKPHLVVVSKGLTGGSVPLSAVLMRDGVFAAYSAAFAPGVSHCSTFAGNLLAMTAGLACIEVIEGEHLLENALEMGRELRRGLEELAGYGRGISRVRGRGLLLCFSLEGDAGPPGLSPAALCWQGLLDRKILTSLAAHAPDYLKVTPPLNVKPEEVRHFLAELAEVLEEVREMMS